MSDEQVRFLKQQIKQLKKNNDEQLEIIKKYQKENKELKQRLEEL